MRKLILGAIMLMITISANDLKSEQSPYLLQHKDNPVHWMAWKKSTMDKAKREKKLIFLSIGYSTCHWCHVMEEESFEKNDVAEVINKDYISIKVDREEMPQLDSFYQSVYQAMNRRAGGWPLTIIMTPEGKTFWSATYIPKKELVKTLGDLAHIYHTDSKSITKVADDIDKFMSKNHGKTPVAIDSDLGKTINVFTKNIKDNFDELNGGQGEAPKFPRASMLEAMLDLYSLNNNKELLDMLNTTLYNMAEGGIYDQIESGFYRYSVDGAWVIPHFEKMLYTQAELLRVYAKAYKITGDKLYGAVVSDLTNFVDKRFSKDNLLYSASDADSKTKKGEKEEGYYFTYKYHETEKFLLSKGYSKEHTKAILGYFNITKHGNFEHGLSNPNIADSLAINDLEKLKTDLAELRSKKEYPFIDKKIQTSWNAMYISALFVASSVDDKYGKRGVEILDTLISKLYINHRLYHQMLSGMPIKVKGLFEDYAFLIDALVDAYEFNYDEKYLTLAKTLSKEAINKFYKDGVWYLSDDEFQSPSSLFDSAYSSAEAVMTRAIFKLATLSDDTKLYTTAKQTILHAGKELQKYPSAIASTFDTYLGYKMGYTVFKSTKDNITTKKDILKNSNNPYLLTKVINIEEELYLACTIDMCYATDKDFNKVLKKINSFYKSTFGYNHGNTQI